MWIKRILKTLLITLISFLGFLLLIFIIFNLPFSHRFISGRINSIFIANHLPIQINSVNTVLPGKIYVEGVLIKGAESDTIVYAGKINADFNTIALLKHKVIVKDAELNNIRVNFSRNSPTGGLNIANAFTSGKTIKDTVPAAKKKQWDITVLKAVLTDLSFIMTDSIGGIFIYEDVKRIKIVADKMSLLEKTLNVKSLEIEGATGTIKLNKIKNAEDDSAQSAPWNFGLHNLHAENTNQVFEDFISKFKIDLVSRELKIEARNIDLAKKIIDFDEIFLSGTNAILTVDSKIKVSDNTKPKSVISFLWDIQGDDINLSGVTATMFRYNDSTGHDPLSNISATNLSMQLSDLKVNDSNLKLDIKALNFDFGNGFSLKKMKAFVDSQSDKTKISLEAETAGSSLNINASADQSLMTIIKDPTVIKNGEISIGKSRFLLSDLFYFRSDLQEIPLFSQFSSAAINLDSDIGLKGSTVTLRSFSLSQSSNFGVTLQGKAENIYNPEKTTGDIKFRINDINNEWAKNLVGKFLPGISIPDYKFLAIEANLSDSLMSPDLNIKINSDLGKGDISGSFNFKKDLFSLKSYFANLKLGTILKNKLLGSFSGSAEINGTGIKNKNITADGTLLIDSIFINNYNYTNSRIEGKIRKDNYAINLSINDPSITLNLNANLNRLGSVLSVKADGNYLANLKNLHLYNDTLVTEGVLKSDFLKERDKIESNISISELKFSTPRDNASLNRFNVSFKVDSLKTWLTSESDFMNTKIHIEEPLKNLSLFLADYVKYIKSLIDTRHSRTLNQISSLPAIDGKINVYYNDVFRIFMPDTSLMFKNISCSVSTNITKNTINYDANFIGAVYKMFNIKNLKFSLADSASVIKMMLNADTCEVAAQPVNNIHLTSQFADWRSLTNLSVVDRKGTQIYNFEINSTNDTSNIYLTIPSEQLILNGTKWQMDSPDLLTINRITKALSPSLRMHTDSSFFKFYNKEETGSQKYTLELGNVAISSIYSSEMWPGKPKATISGITVLKLDKNGGKKLDTDMKFTDLSWSDLYFKQASLYGFFSSEKSDEFRFDITSRLDTSEISIKGEKQLNSKRNIDFRFNSIPVNSVQPFVNQFLSDLRGYVSGDFNLSTRDNSETITGDLIIKDVNLKVNSLNSSFRMTDDKIRFSGKKMTLKRFKVLDSLNHELFIDGSIDFRNKKSVLSDIEISTSNLQVMNRKEEKNSSFFGAIFVDMNLTISGAVSSPVLKGKVTLTKGTDIYFRQQDNLSLSESEKVLTFVSSKSSSGRDEKNSDAGKSILNKTSIESVVEIDPATRLSIDLSNRMFNIGLVIKGGGNLNYNMLVNNQVNLSGKYEIEEGSADLKMIGWPNKAFRISKGGFIRWDGKLDDPELKLEAINKVTSSYVNPVDNKERYVNFDVTLKLSNRLSTMDVAFALNTTDQYLMSIINTLSPDEQMRQAITILLFENVDLPGISTTSNYVSEQVNQIVASQLNALTKTTIKGIDISFGIDSYVQANATGGQQTKTSLSYEVKRKLMNDRAQIELSGRINDGTNQSKSTSYSLNNISFEYKLDSAGTKFLKVYNEHTYEDVFEGEVIKTGVGLTYRKNYPALSDIWRKDEEKKRRRDEEKK